VDALKSREPKKKTKQKKIDESANERREGARNKKWFVDEVPKKFKKNEKWKKREQAKALKRGSHNSWWSVELRMEKK